MPITQAQAEAGVQKERDYTPVEPGRYTLKLYKAPKFWVSANKGNACLSLTFAHTPESQGGAGTHRGVMSTLFVDFPNSYSMEALAGLLTALGVSSEKIVGATLAADPEEVADDNGRTSGVILLGDGEVFRFPIGNLVSAWVGQEEDMNGDMRNKASSFRVYEEIA